MSTIRRHVGDLPDLTHYTGIKAVAIDTETLGLNLHRDRLCVVQLSPGDGSADVVQIRPGQKRAPNIQKLLRDRSITKLFHFGRFDIASMHAAFGTLANPVWCTKIASRLTRTYTDRHGLKALCEELINVSLSKQQQTSDWGAETLTDAQVEYAASDVLYLHALQKALHDRLVRDGRLKEAEQLFRCLPTRAKLDLMGFENDDLFAHA